MQTAETLELSNVIVTSYAVLAEIEIVFDETIEPFRYSASVHTPLPATE